MAAAVSWSNLTPKHITSNPILGFHTKISASQEWFHSDQAADVVLPFRMFSMRRTSEPFDYSSDVPRSSKLWTVTYYDPIQAGSGRQSISSSAGQHMYLRGFCLSTCYTDS